MSSFGSSVINKSSKKLAPKVPIQRRRPADKGFSYNTSSTPERGSVEASSQIQAESSITETGISPRQTPGYDGVANGTQSERDQRPNKRRKVDALVESRNRRGILKGATGRTSEQQHGLHQSTQNTPGRDQIAESAIITDRGLGITPQQAPGAAVDLRIPSKRTRRSSLSAAELVLQASIAETQVARRTRSQLAAMKRADETNHDSARPQPGSEKSAPSTAKKHKKTKPTSTPVETSGDEADQPDDGNAQPSRKKGKKRAMTPPGAEDIQIDTSSVRMADLGKDPRTGKKSRLEAAFQAIDWSDVIKKRKEAEAAALFAVESNAQTQAAAASVKARLEQAGQVAPSSQHRTPQLKLVNGEMVIDNSSLAIDRHADTANAAAALPEEEATNLTVRVNTRSWIYDNRRDPSERHRLTNKSDPWTADQTSAFYDALRMFGTDFYIISKMFPGKTRRHIKLKFVREERSEPARIKEALIGESVPMSLDAYCEATGKDREFYKDPEAIAEDLRQEAEEQKAEINRQREEAAKAARERKEEARKAKDAKLARAKRNRAKGPGGKSSKVAVVGGDVDIAVNDSEINANR